jgi:hypothetical protein
MTGKRSTPTRRLTQLETIRLGAILQQALVIIPSTEEGAPQLVEFKEGWDDERCAKEVSPDLNGGHSQNLRAAVFGKLYVRGPAKDAPDPRVGGLIDEVAMLRKQLWDLTDKYDKLCLALSVNRVVDARHLTVRQPGHHKP